MCPMSCVPCPMSHVPCPVSRVLCPVSPVRNLHRAWSTELAGMPRIGRLGAPKRRSFTAFLSVDKQGIDKAEWGMLAMDGQEA